MDNLTPHQSAIVILRQFGEYPGPEDAFIRESVTVLQAKLKCSLEQAERLIKELRDRGEIDFRMTLGGQLSQDQKMQKAKWHWYIPDRP